MKASVIALRHTPRAALSGLAVLLAVALPVTSHAFECITCAKEWTQIGIQGEQIKQGAEQLRQGQEQMRQTTELVKHTDELIKHTDKLTEMYKDMERNSRIHEEIPRTSIAKDLKQIQQILQTGDTLAEQSAQAATKYRERFQDYSNSPLASGSPVPEDYRKWSKTVRSTIESLLRTSSAQFNQFDDENRIMDNLHALATTSSGRNQLLQVAGAVTVEIVGQLQKLRDMQSAQLMAMSTDMAMRQQSEDLKNFARSKTIPTDSATAGKGSSYAGIDVGVGKTEVKVKVDPMTGKVEVGAAGQNVTVDGRNGTVGVVAGGQTVNVDGKTGTVGLGINAAGQKVDVTAGPKGASVGVNAGGQTVKVDANANGQVNVNAAGQTVSVNPSAGSVGVGVTAAGQSVSTTAGTSGTSVGVTAGGSSVSTAVGSGSTPSTTSSTTSSTVSAAPSAASALAATSLSPAAQQQANAATQQFLSAQTPDQEEAALDLLTKLNRPVTTSQPSATATTGGGTSGTRTNLVTVITPTESTGTASTATVAPVAATSASGTSATGTSATGTSATAAGSSTSSSTTSTSNTSSGTTMSSLVSASDLAGARKQVETQTGVRLPASYKNEPILTDGLNSRIDDASRIVASSATSAAQALDRDTLASVQSQTGILLPSHIDGAPVTQEQALRSLAQAKSMLPTPLDITTALLETSSGSSAGAAGSPGRVMLVDQ